MNKVPDTSLLATTEQRSAFDKLFRQCLFQSFTLSAVYSCSLDL